MKVLGGAADLEKGARGERLEECAREGVRIVEKFGPVR